MKLIPFSPSAIASRILYLIVLSILSGAVALGQAQATSADLVGTVTDPNGAVIAGAVDLEDDHAINNHWIGQIGAGDRRATDHAGILLRHGTKLEHRAQPDRDEHQQHRLQAHRAWMAQRPVQCTRIVAQQPGVPDIDALDEARGLLFLVRL